VSHASIFPRIKCEFHDAQARGGPELQRRKQDKSTSALIEVSVVNRATAQVAASRGLAERDFELKGD
jgi:hypothetical protein